MYCTMISSYVYGGLLVILFVTLSIIIYSKHFRKPIIKITRLKELTKLNLKHLSKPAIISEKSNNYQKTIKELKSSLRQLQSDNKILLFVVDSLEESMDDILYQINNQEVITNQHKANIEGLYQDFVRISSFINNKSVKMTALSMISEHQKNLQDLNIYV